MNFSKLETFLRGVLAAAIGGALTSVASSIAGGHGKAVGAAAAAGALTSVAHLFIPSPSQS